MMKSLKNMLKQDKEKYTVPKSVHDYIPITAIWEDGIFKVGNKYAKTFRFTDINYLVAGKEDKETMFLCYSELLNSLDSGATTKLTINNRRINKVNFEKEILIPETGDELDCYREEYNNILLDKASNANGIIQEKYLTVSVVKKDIEEVRTYFSRITSDLRAHFSALGSKCEELDAAEKLRLLHDFYRAGEEASFRFDLEDMMKKGHDFKDYICPDSMERADDTGTGLTVQTVISDINAKYEAKINETKGMVAYDVLEMSGTRAVWPDVLSVYAVKTAGDPNNPQEVATIDESKRQILKEIFWAMNEISFSTATKTENANRKNLITGTRYMNVEGMLTFENMVADYIKETNHHVAYRVTPIYEGNNLVCSGVQIEAYSVEDGGEGICFNVYCYNVQPGITIDYATGNSSGPQSSTTSKYETTKSVESVTQPPAEQPGNTDMVWIPKSGSKYHSRSSCSNMKNPTRVSKSEAISRGYEPCKKCY